MSPLRRRFIDDMRLRNLSPRTVEAYVHGIDDHRQKTMTLDALEFLRCFVTHVLPSGFVKARYYGLLANRFRDERLSKCRQLLLPAQIMDRVNDATADNAEPQSLPERCCRACGVVEWNMGRCRVRRRRRSRRAIRLRSAWA